MQAQGQGTLSSAITFPMTKGMTADDGKRIWLVEAAQTLHNRHPRRNLSFHGFDISPAQFPFSSLKAPRHNIQLTVHDILQPFPKEHWGRYDLVHVRLLVGAMKEVDYPRAVRNLYDLLSESCLPLLFSLVCP
jgi:hypothetical protein